MRLPALFILTVSILKFSCNGEEKTKTIDDYQIGESNDTKFLPAQLFRNEGKFKKADSAFSVLLKSNLTTREKEFVILNQFLCRFVENDTLYLNEELRSSHFRGLSSLVKGIQLSRKNRSGFEELHKARQLLFHEGLENSFYYFCVFEQLGLAHRQKISFADSVQHYYKTARNFLLERPELQRHQGRILFRLAKIHQVNRDEVTGIGYLDEALLYDSSEDFVVDVLVLKTGLLRGEGRIRESTEIRSKAFALATKSNSKKNLFKVLQERALFAISMANDSLFHTTLDELKILSPVVAGAPNFINRLLARYHYLNDQYIESIPYGKAALEGYTKERFPDSKLVFEALHILCSSYTNLEKYELGRYYAYKQLVYSTSLRNTEFSFENALAREIQAESYNFIVYDLLGALYLKEYSKTGKHSLLKKSYTLYTVIDSLIAQKVRTQEEESTLEFLGIGHEIYSNALATCYALQQVDPNDRWIESAHRFMERSKSLSIYQDILKHDENYFPHVPQTIKLRELELKTRLSFIKRKSLQTTSNELQRALQEQDLFFRMLETKYPEYYLARYNPKITPAASIRSHALQENKTIISYHLAASTLYALRYDQTMKFIAIPLPKGFADSVLRFRQLLAQSTASSTGSFKKLSNSLFTTLLQPLSPLKENLEIVPEDVLSYLPFEVLISDTLGDFKTLPYLIKKHSIQYKVGLKSIKNATRKPFKHIVGYAFTLHDKQLPTLPGALKELETIKTIFSDAQLRERKGNEVSKKQFLKDLEDEIDLLHLSVHATSDPDNRLLNRIYFKSGKMVDTVYGFEIVPKLVKAHTVVLTSCESGYGTVVQGEGTFSLTRAFLQTGVETVVSSLWSLPDYSSPLLCHVFYSEIKAGSSPAIALRKAKINYLNTADLFTASPFYWAGLTCHQH